MNHDTRGSLTHRRAERVLETHDVLTVRRLLAAIGCALLVLGAVAFEILSGQAANSPEITKWQVLIPLGWPQPVRVLWWLVIAVAAAGHRLLLDPHTDRRRRLIALAAAAPFTVFAGSIAFGTSWSTWH